MCLDTVTKTVTLEEDLRVWKYMEIPDGCRIERTPYIGTKLNRRINRVKNISVITAENHNVYPSGFHCHVTEDAAQQHADRFEACSNVATPIVLDYIIPAGTEVTYGRDSGSIVIVSPILINPRIPEKTP